MHPTCSFVFRISLLQKHHLLLSTSFIITQSRLMKFSEVKSYGEDKGKFPASLPEDPLDIRARRDFIKEFTEWVFPGYAANWQHVEKTCTESVCRQLSEVKADSVNRARPEFQDMLKGQFSEFRDRLKDWLENYPGDKRIALSIAVAEWSDNCDLITLSAVLQRSNSAEESFRHNSM